MALHMYVLAIVATAAAASAAAAAATTLPPAIATRGSSPFNRAHAALRQRKFASALSHLAASSERRSVALRARILLTTGSFGAAARSYRRVGEAVSATLAEAMGTDFVAAQALVAEGRVVEAYNKASQLLAVSIEAPNLYLLRAECALALNFFFAVQSDVARVLESALSADTRATSYRILASAHYRAFGDLDQAAALLKRCLWIAPGEPNCGRELGRIRQLLAAWRGATASEKAGELARAAEHLAELLHLDPLTPLRQRALTRSCALRREIALRSCFGVVVDDTHASLCYVTDAAPVAASPCPQWHSILSVALLACNAAGDGCVGIVEVGGTACRGRAGCAARYELRATMGGGAAAAEPAAPSLVDSGAARALRPHATTWTKHPRTADALCDVIAVDAAIVECEAAEEGSASLLRSAMDDAEVESEFKIEAQDPVGVEAELAASVQINLAWAAQQQAEWQRARYHMRAAKLVLPALDPEKDTVEKEGGAEKEQAQPATMPSREREFDAAVVGEAIEVMKLRLQCIGAAQTAGEENELSVEALYALLGLLPSASRAEVKRAYFALALRWHPDKHGSALAPLRAHAERRFLGVADAYRRLKAIWKGEGDDAEGDEDGDGGGGGGGDGTPMGGFDWIFDSDDLSQGGWQTGFDGKRRTRVNVDDLQRKGRWFGCARQHLCLPKRPRFAQRPPPPRTTAVAAGGGGNVSTCWNCTSGEANVSVSFIAVPSFASGFFLVEGGEPFYRCVGGIAASSACNETTGKCDGEVSVALERGVYWASLHIVACSSRLEKRTSWRRGRRGKKGKKTKTSSKETAQKKARDRAAEAEEATCTDFDQRVCSQPKHVPAFVV